MAGFASIGGVLRYVSIEQVNRAIFFAHPQVVSFVVNNVQEFVFYEATFNIWFKSHPQGRCFL